MAEIFEGCAWTYQLDPEGLSIAVLPLGTGRPSAEYLIKIVSGNDIFGIASLRLRPENEEGEMLYELGDCIPLASYIEKNQISFLKSWQMLTEIVQIMVKAERFLIPSETFILRPDYVFIDSNRHIRLLCLPWRCSQDAPQALQLLFEALISRLKDISWADRSRKERLNTCLTKDFGGMEFFAEWLTEETPSDWNEVGEGKTQLFADNEEETEWDWADGERKSMLRCAGKWTGVAFMALAAAAMLWDGYYLWGGAAAFLGMLMTGVSIRPRCRMQKTIESGCRQISDGYPNRETKNGCVRPVENGTADMMSTAGQTALPPRMVLKRKNGSAQEVIPINGESFVLMAGQADHPQNVGCRAAEFSRNETRYILTRLDDKVAIGVNGGLLAHKQTVALHPGDTIQIRQEKYIYDCL